MQLSAKHSEILDKNLEAIQSITAIIADTLGPDGLDVMLIDEFSNSFCTNDGVAILNNIQIKNPIAKYVRDAAISQEEKVGDGTTSVCVMLTAMLEKAIQEIKNNDLSAVQVAKELNQAKIILVKLLKNLSKKIENLEDSNLFFASRVAARNNEELSKLVTELYRRNFKNQIVDFFDLSNHIYAYKNQEQRIVEGLLLKKKAHLNKKRKVKNGSVLLIQGSFEPMPISSEAANTDEGVKKFTNNVQEILEVCKKIKRREIDAVFCSGSIFHQAEEMLNKEGIFVLSHLTDSQFEDLKLLSKARPITRSELFEQGQGILLDNVGEFKSIDWDEELKAFLINGAYFHFHSLIVSQNTPSMLEEQLRVAQDAAKVFFSTFKEGFVEGGGITELLLLEEFKKQSQFSSSINEIIAAGLNSIFEQIRFNSGLDKSFDELRSEYRSSQVIDSSKVKGSIIEIAIELCSQIIKVKNIVSAN